MASNWKVFDQNPRAAESAEVGSTIHLDIAKPETTAPAPAYPPGHRSPKCALHAKPISKTQNAITANTIRT